MNLHQPDHRGPTRYSVPLTFTINRVNRVKDHLLSLTRVMLANPPAGTLEISILDVEYWLRGVQQATTQRNEAVQPLLTHTHSNIQKERIDSRHTKQNKTNNYNNTDQPCGLVVRVSDY